MRTDVEIKSKIKEVGAKLDTRTANREVIDAILDVLENDLEAEQIEDKYFDEHRTERESSAMRAREWMDGDITDEDFYF